MVVLQNVSVSLKKYVDQYLSQRKFVCMYDVYNIHTCAHTHTQEQQQIQKLNRCDLKRFCMRDYSYLCTSCILIVEIFVCFYYDYFRQTKFGTQLIILLQDCYCI